MKPLCSLIALLLIPALSAVAADDSPSLPTAQEIVTRMAALDMKRQSSIEGYEGIAFSLNARPEPNTLHLRRQNLMES